MTEVDADMVKAIIHGFCKAEREYGDYNDKEACAIFLSAISEYGYKIVKDTDQ